jgi:hypothetical protein
LRKNTQVCASKLCQKSSFGIVQQHIDASIPSGIQTPLNPFAPWLVSQSERCAMKITPKAALVAFTITILPFASAGPVSARNNVGVSLNFGNISSGYSDGYWNNDHSWHRWNNRSDANRYRAQYQGQYHNMNHTRAANNGWKNR